MSSQVESLSRVYTILCVSHLILLRNNIMITHIRMRIPRSISVCLSIIFLVIFHEI